MKGRTSQEILWKKLTNRQLVIFVSLAIVFNINGLNPEKKWWIHLSLYNPLILGYSILGGRGHWAVYYPSPQSFIITFPYLLEYYFILIGWLFKLSINFNQKLKSTDRVILCITIGDVYQFISQCLIPLDPW